MRYIALLWERLTIKSVICPSPEMQHTESDTDNTAGGHYHIILPKPSTIFFTIFIMKLLPTLFIFTAAVSACSDPAYRCKNPQGSKDGDYSKTSEICAEVGNGASMCYCYGAAEHYCYLNSSDNMQKFLDYCKADAPWYPSAC